MISEFEEFKLERPQPLYQQVVSFFEKNIYAGKLKAGDKIPTTADLSKQFNLAKNTVQQALSILVERGLIERITGRGTFITNQVNSKTIAIVSGLNFMFDESGRFYQLICANLQLQFEKAGWKVELYIPANNNDCDKMLFDLGRDCTEGSIRAVVVACRNHSITEWLERNCKVPYLNDDFIIENKHIIENTVQYRGLAHLLGLGLKKIAFMTTHSNKEYVEEIISKVKSDLNSDSDIEPFTSVGINERYAYQLVKDKIIPIVSEFDALFIDNDVACRGVLFGMVEAGIKMPDDLAVITHANKGVEILSPVSLTRIEVDPEKFAVAVVENLLAKIDGRKDFRSLSLPEIIVGESCGEASS